MAARRLLIPWAEGTPAVGSVLAFLGVLVAAEAAARVASPRYLDRTR